MSQRKLRTFKLSDLKPPKGWREALDEKVVEQIAESLQKEGLREPIVVIPDGHIRHGVHRWAAARAAKLEQIECIVEEQTETAEAHEAMVIVENLARRHFSSTERNTMLAELVKLREAKIEKKTSVTPRKESGAIGTAVPKGTPEKIGHRPLSARGQAIREVAEEHGVEEAALKKAVQRAEMQFGPPGGDAPGALVGPTDALGMEIPEAHRANWHLLSSSHKRIANLVQQIQTEITRLKDAAGDGRTPLGATLFSRVQHWRDFVSPLGHEARAYQPHAVCMKCKADAKHLAACTLCRGLGILSVMQYENAPSELRGETRSARSVMEAIG